MSGDVSLLAGAVQNGTLNNTGTDYYTEGGYIDAALTGIVGLTKDGDGTLTLAGANTYTGTTTIHGGTLRLSDVNALGGGGTITFTGGTLQFAANNAVDYSSRIRYSSNAVALDIDMVAGIVAFASALDSTNTGGLTTTGNGVLELESANAYSGDTTINGGTVLESHNANAIPHGAGAGNLVVNGQLELFTSITVNGLFGSGTILPMSMSSPTITVGGNDQTSTFSGSFSNFITLKTTLVKIGSGTLTLSGSNIFNSVTISGGTLQIGAGGTSGTLGSSGVTNNASLVFNRADNITVSNAITGTGSVTQQGTGTLTLSGATQQRQYDGQWRYARGDHNRRTARLQFLRPGQRQQQRECISRPGRRLRLELDKC